MSTPEREETALVSDGQDRHKPLVSIEKLVKRFPGMEKPALRGVSGQMLAGSITGLVGPDGAGKTTLIRLMVGLLLADEGSIRVAELDPSSQAEDIHAVTGYMPQKFGLYDDLSVFENLRLYADLRDVTGGARTEKFERLLKFTALEPFQSRLAGKLSGGMKQKLGLACALLGDPKVLFLDEPSVGVDPISRRELWGMVQELLTDGMAVIWSTSYLDEAEQCDSVMLLNEGQVLYHGPPASVLKSVEGRTWQISGIAQDKRRSWLMRLLAGREVTDAVIQGRSLRIVTKETVREMDSCQAKGAPREAVDTDSGRQTTASPGQRTADNHSGSSHASECIPALGLSPEDKQSLEQGNAAFELVTPRFEDAFIDMLGGGPSGASALAEVIEDKPPTDAPVIDAQSLTKHFGDFTAVKDNTFQIKRGEIFGLLGPNGAGKSTTFKMMCGLLQPTSGTALIMGLDLKKSSSEARSKIGYMAQKFSLYSALNVAQNLQFFSGVYGLSGATRQERIDMMVELFKLHEFMSMSAETLPLGFKQRLALACSIMHQPDILFLDEPTSGVDPVTRREFWLHINAMVQKGITVMVTTHFMDEAEYCDRIALIYHGENIATGTPDDLKDQARSDDLLDPTLEDAFIALVKRSDEASDEAPSPKHPDL